MDEDGWSPYYVLICDDIRLEVNGKQILIGTYNEIMVVPNFPANVTLSFRVAVRMHRIGFDSCRFRVSAPNGAILSDVTGNVTSQTTDEHVTFTFQRLVFLLSEPAEYLIEFGLGDSLKKVGRLLVRPPANDEERRMLNV